MKNEDSLIDGVGGGIGSQVVERLKSLNSNDMKIIALGTNSQATINMLKSGAANSMMGEISAKMPEVTASSSARKLLIFVSKCHIDVIGLESLQFKAIFNELTIEIEKILEKTEEK